jgi:hypothetical protein
MNSHQDAEMFISLAGSLFVISGVLRFSKRVIFIRKGVKAEGEVLRIEKKSWNFRLFDYQYYPVIKYLTLEGKSITQEYGTATPLNIYNEGEKLTIYYDKTENNNFIIDTWLTRWSGPLLVFIGFCLLAVAIRLYFVAA